MKCKKYDLKVGFACNNNCVHCVVKPNYMDPKDYRVRSELDNTDKALNFSYKNIIDILDSDDLSEISSIVVTGGEPTLRKDFLQIIKYIKKSHPMTNICIQTNGRLLGKYAKSLHEIDPCIYFVVALHSHCEKTHNLIVNNKLQQEANPYKEVVESIKEILKYYPSNLLRIEVVLSKYNYTEMNEIVDFCKGLNIKNIGFSYPHFDGFFMYDPSYVYENSISFNELKPYLLKLVDVAKNNPDMNITLEAVPFCMLSSDGKLPQNLIPEQISSFEENVKLQYPGQEAREFNKSCTFDKKNTCVKCSLNNICAGTWSEAIIAFPDDIYKPIN